MQLTLDARACPDSPAETAERYAMQWLDADEASTFRMHADGCRQCAEMLADYAAFANLLRTALDEACVAPPRRQSTYMK